MNCPVFRPRTLDEALRALESADSNSRLLAGGTDLMVEFANGRTRPERVFDLWGLSALRYIRAEGGGVRFGALSTCRDMLSSALARERAELLVQAADQVGAEQIKNRATLGGNLGTASPASDLGPVLFALDARVRLLSLRGDRELPIDDFWTGYRATALVPGELIESIFVPARPAHERCRFRKLGTRRAQSISKVVVAIALRIEHGQFFGVRAAAGSVAERIVRLETLERALEGSTMDFDLVRRATRASALADARPIDDVRSSALYRRVTLQRVTHTMITELAGVQ